MKKLIVTLCATAMAALATPASAITFVLQDTVADPLGTRYVYGGTYAHDPNTGDTMETMIPGARFAIIDFAGYVDGTIVSGNPRASASIEMLSSDLMLPPGVVDDPNIPNLVFTWISDVFTPTPDYSFSGYGAVSIYPYANGNTVAFSSTTQNAENGSPLYMLGSVGGPAAGDNLPVAPVPELASWAMMVAGFGMAGAMMRRHKGVTMSLA